MSDVSKEANRKAWNNAIALNQINGPWEPDAEFKELMEKEINGEITTQEMRERLIKKYTQKYSDK